MSCGRSVVRRGALPLLGAACNSRDQGHPESGAQQRQRQQQWQLRRFACRAQSINTIPQRPFAHQANTTAPTTTRTNAAAGRSRIALTRRPCSRSRRAAAVTWRRKAPVLASASHQPSRRRSSPPNR
ncbi:hypothetical protein [Lysobacter gummosus]|uniref:hypothetical protein n=1 Tax=Lysobacter gummosus TaxID=262324 RepID=UPI00362CFEEE